MHHACTPECYLVLVDVVVLDTEKDYFSEHSLCEKELFFSCRSTRCFHGKLSLAEQAKSFNSSGTSTFQPLHWTVTKYTFKSGNSDAKLCLTKVFDKETRWRLFGLVASYTTDCVSQSTNNFVSDPVPILQVIGGLHTKFTPSTFTA